MKKKIDEPERAMLSDYKRKISSKITKTRLPFSMDGYRLIAKGES